jgi:hypothetical protein
VPVAKTHSFCIEHNINITCMARQMLLGAAVELSQFLALQRCGCFHPAVVEVNGEAGLLASCMYTRLAQLRGRSVISGHPACLQRPLWASHTKLILKGH